VILMDESPSKDLILKELSMNIDISI
jgi:hypothetical protein